MTPSSRWVRLLARLVQVSRAIHAAALYRWLVHWHSRLQSVTSLPAMVFAPHPDDETLGCGGLISQKRRAGIAVEIVVLTNGAKAPGLCSVAGMDSSPTLQGLPRQPEGSVERREREALTATGLLGVPAGAVHFLRWPDSDLGQLSQSEREQCVLRLAQLLRTHRPREVYLPHWRDGHPDHEAAYRLVAEAVFQAGIPMELIQYPVWLTWLRIAGITLHASDVIGAEHVRIQSELAVKTRAVGAYPSQTSTFPAGFRSRFLSPYEVYFRPDCRSAVEPG
jgi:N-acetylglucosamine malate deacetylase 1